ncbi:hypothetical protein FQN60_007575 [Etheostoma spectabile]|uniref:Uncharacterized protein n=1 Tax=Etheostoma spectabile TaxID=54343 RepID=A0A5J5CZH9_9PERO|nr:hypothetical protein FQN60_007575 [Etheostoma spectabile]
MEKESIISVLPLLLASDGFRSAGLVGGKESFVSVFTKKFIKAGMRILEIVTSRNSTFFSFPKQINRIFLKTHMDKTLIDGYEVEWGIRYLSEFDTSAGMQFGLTQREGEEDKTEMVKKKNDFSTKNTIAVNISLRQNEDMLKYASCGLAMAIKRYAGTAAKLPPFVAYLTESSLAFSKEKIGGSSPCHGSLRTTAADIHLSLTGSSEDMFYRIPLFEEPFILISEECPLPSRVVCTAASANIVQLQTSTNGTHQSGMYTNLNLFHSPQQHPRVIGSHTLEEMSVDGQNSASQHWTPVGDRISITLLAKNRQKCIWKFSLQSNTPLTGHWVALNWKVCQSITSMMGDTTLVLHRDATFIGKSKWHLSWATLSSSGSSQPFWHSQWESINTSTSPAALAAPSVRHPPTPRRLVLRIKRTASR